jgi:MvaI/BcnI restriction endonuclease family
MQRLTDTITSDAETTKIRGGYLVGSLGKLLDLMRNNGATRIYAKKLAPNDNSKNQVYLGGDFSALNIIPHHDIVIDTSEKAGSKRDRPKADVDFYWLDENGRHHAPDAKLILYPDYPEVRMSGLLKDCRAAPSGIMTVRDVGRILLFGVTREGLVLGYAVAANDQIAKELNAGTWASLGVFLELPLSITQSDPKVLLLSELRRIFEQQWIASQKLEKDGTKKAYSARNGGGYTLEAELGITPNGYAEPDFMGWEVKQYGVSDFAKLVPKSPVTLMTPEPTGGVYRTAGITEFMQRFGYADKNDVADRINFGGIYQCNKHAYHADTGLRMTLSGFDAAKGQITNLEGGLELIDANGEIAATWGFAGLMKHWNRKHAQAAYVPSIFREPPPEYSYGARILLCERTDFILFLKAFSAGLVVYDPGIKMENVSSAKPLFKKRSQFRVRHSHLTELYHSHEFVNLME